MSVDRYFNKETFLGVKKEVAIELIKEILMLLNSNMPISPTNLSERYGVDRSIVGKAIDATFLVLEVLHSKDQAIEAIFDSIKLPDPEKYLSSDLSYKIEGVARIGVLADVHIPFFDKESLIAALKFFKRNDITHLVLLGDFVDFYAISFWEKEPSRRNLKNELEIAKQMLSALRQLFDKEEIIYVEGNHERRWIRYIEQKAPELYGIEDLDFKRILRLDDHGIKYICDGTYIEAGHLYMIHGHEYRSYASINIAVSYLRKSFRNIMLGHFHQSQEYIQRRLDGGIEGAWVVGCMCDLRPSYMPNTNWTHGFAMVDVNSDGTFIVLNKKVYSGNIV